MKLSTMSGCQQEAKRPSPLLIKLEAIRPQMAAAAMAVIDDWQDDELGGGGVCDLVAAAIAEVIAGTIHGVELLDAGHEGDDHAAVYVHDGVDAYLIDVPYDLYESGGGMLWNKLDDAFVSPEDVTIEPIRIDDVLGRSANEDY